MQTRPETSDMRRSRHLLCDAITWAALLHREQVRKGTDVPYLSHLLAVAGLVMEYGGDYDLAAAGVLHDAVEDTEATDDDVRVRFGNYVADVVLACTDTAEGGDASAKAPWRERKERAIARLRDASPDACLVAACDRLHNLRCQVADLRRGGETVRFNASLEDRAWSHHESFAAIEPKLPRALSADLAAVVDEWLRLSLGEGASL